LVYLAFILLGVGLRYWVTPLQATSYAAVVRVAGIGVALAGFWMIADAWKLFKNTGQDPKPWKPSPELVLNGVYRFTRNPMYVGMTCIQVGLGLALNNLWIVLLALVSLLTVHFIAVLPEERYLTEKFGHSYRSYVEKVRRYL